MATCNASISIAQIAEAPCCAWQVTTVYPCANRLHNLYPNGTVQVQLYHPVQIYPAGENAFFLKDTAGNHATIRHSDNITVADEALDTPASEFEAYLRTLFCCQCHTQQNSPQYRCYPVDEEGNIILPEPE